MGANGSKEVRPGASPEIIQFPQTFEVHYRHSLHFELQLRDPATKTQYLASLPGGWLGEMILHNGPNRNCRPLASATPKGVRYKRHQIHLFLGWGWDRTQEEMQTRTYWKADVNSFTCSVGNSLEQRRENFEWRRADSSELKKLGESGRGNKLMRLRGRDGAEETVALWAAGSTFGSVTRAAKFEFVGSGATGELGDSWALMTVITFLAIWQRGMGSPP